MTGGKRMLVTSFVPPSICKELEFIHKSCAVAGYRPHVLSTTLSHLIATNCLGLVVPFIELRDKVKELVEEEFGCEYELFVEFTSLISWTTGAKIGWHSDNDRPYLKQRHFTDVLIYEAGDMHCVDEIIDGERCTLALWFTKDSSHDEDIKLIKQIGVPDSSFVPLNEQLDKTTNCPVFSFGDNITGKSAGSFCSTGWSKIFTPVPASYSMYRVDVGRKHMEIDSQFVLADCTVGYDIRVARMASLGFEFFTCTAEKSSFVSSQVVKEYPSLGINNSEEAVHVLERPVKLKFNGKELPFEFSNSTHALQVVLFSLWKNDSPEYLIQRGANCSTHCQTPELHCSENPMHNAEMQGITKLWTCPACIAMNASSSSHNQDENTFSTLLIPKWEQYMLNHWKYFLECYPIWKTSKALCTCDPHNGEMSKGSIQIG